MKHDFLLICDDVAFLDAPSFDGAFDGAVPYAKQNLSGSAGFQRLRGEGIC